MNKVTLKDGMEVYVVNLPIADIDEHDGITDIEEYTKWAVKFGSMGYTTILDETGEFSLDDIVLVSEEILSEIRSIGTEVYIVGGCSSIEEAIEHYVYDGDLEENMIVVLNMPNEE